MQDIVYLINDSLYINLTNRCTNQCVFCIRAKKKRFQGKYNLWLKEEPSSVEILKAIESTPNYKQIVFCGYGEPLIRLETIKIVAKSIKEKNNKMKIRIDTNGQANLFFRRNILPELKGLIDIISISLNAENSKTYDKICNSIFGENAFYGILDFIKEAKKHIPSVEVSIVNCPSLIDIEKSKKTIEGLGVSFRLRSYYEDDYIP